MYRYSRVVSRKAALTVVLAILVNPSVLLADVNGGDFWEVIGLGNMSCEELSVKSKDEGYRELAAVWLSGFMSGVNFTAEEVYDITRGEDLYMLRDMILKGCMQKPEKVLADIASEVVFQRYQNKHYTSQEQIEK